MSVACWVVGASGLLGRATTAAARSAGWTVRTSAVPWERPEEARAVLSAEAERFLAEAAGRPWAIAWCAGAGVVGTGREVLEAEVATFAGFLDDLGSLLDADTAARGAFFHASSAGGVLAGSSGPPFTEATEPRPLAPYGEFKLRAEACVRTLGDRTGVRCAIGRISNLYGPGQDLAKPQGLISQVGRSCLTRQPISLYVSLDTMRDYLYVDDCARMVVACLARTLTTGSAEGTVVTKILAAGRSTTIAAILGEYRAVFRRPPPVTLASSPSSRFQVRDLRLRSLVWTDLDGLVRTTLPAGVAATIRDVSDQLHRTSLVRTA